MSKTGANGSPLLGKVKKISTLPAAFSVKTWGAIYSKETTGVAGPRANKERMGMRKSFIRVFELTVLIITLVPPSFRGFSKKISVGGFCL